METLYTENLPEKIITGIRLKLEIKNSDDKKELDNYFNEYAKIVTFAAKRITAYRSL
ncbi:MAG: hypothetical protein HYW23_00660, partial [Candidatus Aenigmarchaeota archaeon]|nr:hypothetical protein [Candidatus Aenigmarchaeota archaeon]